MPLDPAGLGRVAVVGQLAAVRNLGDGGSSDVWAPGAVTPLEGLRAALPDVEVVHGEDAAVAAGADVAVVVVGYTKLDEGEFIGGSGTRHLTELMPAADEPEVVEAFRASLAELDLPRFEPPEDPFRSGRGFSKGGDRTSLRLRPEDEVLIAAVVAACPRTIVAIVAGSAVVVDGWDGTVPALVQSWYAGMEGGHALADVLLGRAEPSGRLPFTVPRDPADLPPFDPAATAVTYDGWHGYWRLARDGHEAAYPFGFGLAYTELALAGASARLVDGAVLVSAVATNRGDRPGVEVVQVYGRAGDGPRRLVGFARVELAAGEARTCEIEVPLERLARRGPGTWLPVEGPVELRVARWAGDPDAIEVEVATSC
ncbi:MAG: glycoside hydrolase family 3 C-terminal domain-containing protein [Acidimicrobiales bacterium]